MPLVRPPTQQSTSSSSVTAQTNGLPIFKPCPRSNFVAGHNDWLAVTSPKPFLDFDICPDCYNTSFHNTRYQACISPSPAKLENVGTKCDFSERWIRNAFAWLFIQCQPDLNLMGEVASIQRDEDGVCPNFNFEDPEVKKGGRPAVKRTWYCLQDPKTGTLVEELTACSDCVEHIKLIFPCLKSIFAPVADGQKLLATCDMMTIGDGEARCLEYFDSLASVAQATLETGTRDITPLIEYIKTWAPVPICQKGNAVAGQKRYSLPTTIPEFTACEECYLKHIAPNLAMSPPPIIVSQLQYDMPATGAGFMCDLFSPRLQQYWKDAALTNDVATYRQKLIARNNKMQEINLQLGRMKQEYQQLKMQSEMHIQQCRIEQMRATTANMAWMSTGWIGPPIDWGATNAQMSRGGEFAIKAAMTLDKMTALEKEWADYWE
ncbi:hypothetical protein EJ02DRAFT_452271 [Clathrospora elynae]|uniref:Uncharacterized protein n=1 Tax=Clathrospora elynae TaxID=706981 RepID=A0A6A5T1S9_9PLEO|nr:hypothetical protein EJ02DRAFT_452271 [Clathrospora elynae]